MKKLFFFSILLHLVVVALFYQYSSEKQKEEAKNQAPKSIKTVIVSAEQFKQIVESSRSQKEASSTPSDRSRYQAEFTQRVDKQTRAKNFGSVEGKKRQDPSKGVKKPKSVGDRIGALWSVPLDSGNAPESGSVENKPSLAQGSHDALDREIAIGTHTLLNTDEYVHAGFYNRVKREISPRWQPVVEHFLRHTRTLKEGSFFTRYAFFVDSRGDVQDAELLVSSGSRSLDDIALIALKEAGRFPNPPEALKADNGLYRFEMGFSVDYTKRGAQTQYVPDPRFRSRL